MAKTITLPQIDIMFKQLATTFVERSERGIPILIIRDNTDTSFQVKEYADLDELSADKELYNTENYQYISDVLLFEPTKCVVIRLSEDQVVQVPDEDSDDGGMKDELIAGDKMSIALNLIKKKYKTGWIGGVLEDTEYQAIANWVKARRKENLTFKCIGVGLDGSNARGVHEFENPSVTFNDERGQQPAKYYIPSLLGICAKCNILRGVTYYICKNLLEVEEVEDVDNALNKGKFILINDYDKVRVGLGINSLTEFDNKTTFEDMRYIDINEALDMISDDIRKVFKEEYIGKVKNKYDNQVMFISAVNNYFDDLTSPDLEVLDNTYKNVAGIDVQAQRKAWTNIKPEAKEWDDVKVKNMSFKRSVYVSGDIKVLGAMENLQFGIMFN